MNTRERILTIRLIQKLAADPDYAERLGIERGSENLLSAGEPVEETAGVLEFICL